MNIQIINTGRELMLGFRLNTHHQWLCQQLTHQGYSVARQMAVDDSGPAITEAVREALQQADIIITTGGLGPTSDDRTRELIAEMLERPLRRDPRVVEHIEGFFHARRRACPERVHVQADVPEGAEVLMNAFGTAPGLVMRVDTRPDQARPAWLIMLPGPPRELYPMFTEQVLPIIHRELGHPVPVASSILRTTGMGESWVEEKLAEHLRPLEADGLETGYCARPGEVDVQLLVRSPNAVEILARAEEVVWAHMGEWIFGTGGEELEEVVVRMLRERRLTLAVVESCTGGFLAHRITNVPGASEVFLGGLVTYSNAAKERFLGVAASTLEAHGAVSKPVSQEMALGARQATGADYALSLTGIAGPGGGTEEKPVGTVCIGLATPEGVSVKRFLNPYDRITFKYVSSQQALEWLRRTLGRGQT